MERWLLNCRLRSYDNNQLTMLYIIKPQSPFYASFSLKDFTFDFKHFHTECSDWKLSKVNCCGTETMRFWPHVGQVEIHLRASRFVQFLKKISQFSAVSLQFLKNIPPSKCILVFQCRLKSTSIRFYSHLLLTIFN